MKRWFEKVVVFVAMLTTVAARADIVMDRDYRIVVRDYSVRLSVAVAVAIFAMLGVGYVILVMKREERDTPKLIPFKDDDKFEDGQNDMGAGQ